MAEPKGFIRTGSANPGPVSKEQKAQLLRKGNELFNQGRYDMAERIFLTLHYTDGLTRLGDLFYKRGDFPRAARLFQQAPDPRRLELVCRQMAGVVRLWLTEESERPSPSKAGQG